VGELELNISVGDGTFQATGDAEVVMKALAEFKTLIEAAPRARRPPAKDKEPGDRQPPANGDNEDSGDTGKPLAVFVKRNWPNQAAKATAIVMWARDNGSKDGLKPSEIEAHWRKTSGKVPANPSQVCLTAETQGWLHNEGKGVYSVTGHGEDMVKSTPLT
jgi:hypothetical protein